MTIAKNTANNRSAMGGLRLSLLAGAATLLSACAQESSEPDAAATEQADDSAPEMSELEKGMRRMETQEVLVTTEEPMEPLEGVKDSWEYTLAPFESVEFKYTIAEGEPITFRWEASDVVHFDMHSHPFEGGTDLTESYDIGDARSMQGRYTAPFTGIHGWFWENRTLEDITVRVEASGAMSSSTIYHRMGSEERPLEGASAAPEGSAKEHEMQEF